MTEKVLLKVQMFGDFTLSLGSETILSSNSRKNKVTYLLQYLLVHREKDFSRDALIKLLYESDDTKDPANALKIIVHRLRKFLVSVGLKDYEYILHEKGRYGWNCQIPCQVDAEIFDKNIELAGDSTLSDEERLQRYLQAINVYNGEFLPDLNAEDWVAPLAIYYQNLYHSAIHKAVELLDKKGDFDTMLDISSRAAALFPYDEEIQILKILSLYKKRQIKESVDTYNATVEMLFNEYGVNPSEELLEVYEKITHGLSNVQDSILDIRDLIAEHEDDKGAYFSNFHNFASSYHLMVRNMERTGLSSYLMLCTLDEQKDFIKLQTAIKNALRRGDIFSRYSSNQYIILLLGIDYEKCEIVFKRIKDRFSVLCKNKCANLSYSVASAIDPKWIEEKMAQ